MVVFHLVLNLKYSCCSIKLLSLSSLSFFVTFDTMLLVGYFFSSVYGRPLVRCLLHFLIQSSLSNTG